MPINRYWMPVIVIVALLGTVFVAQALGLWSVSGKSEINAGQLAPQELKGWMTLQQVATGLGISVEEIYQVSGIPANVPANTALKELEGSIEVSTLRLVLADYLAAREAPAPTPAAAPTQEPPTATPTTAATALPETTASEEEHISESGTRNGTGNGTRQTPLPAGTVLPADQIRGRMTLREVSTECGVDLSELLSLLNLPAGTDLDTPLKTLKDNGILDEVSRVKDAVAALQ